MLSIFSLFPSPHSFLFSALLFFLRAWVPAAVALPSPPPPLQIPPLFSSGDRPLPSNPYCLGLQHRRRKNPSVRRPHRLCPFPLLPQLHHLPLPQARPRDSDSHFVYQKVSKLFRHHLGGISAQLLTSNHALKASVPTACEVLDARTERPDEEGEEASMGLCCYEEARVEIGESTTRDFKLVCKTLYGWKEAISPHLAVVREGMAVEDSSLREVLGRLLNSSMGGGDDGRKEKVWRVIETFGNI